MSKLSKRHLDQFKKDHQGELWDELEDEVQKVKPSVHQISGDNFPELEPHEQVALLEEAASVIGIQNPINTVLLGSYKALVDSLSLPDEIRERLLVMPSTISLPSTKHLTG